MRCTNSPTRPAFRAMSASEFPSTRHCLRGTILEFSEADWPESDRNDELMDRPMKPMRPTVKRTYSVYLQHVQRKSAANKRKASREAFRMNVAPISKRRWTSLGSRQPRARLDVRLHCMRGIATSATEHFRLLVLKNAGFAGSCCEEPSKNVHTSHHASGTRRPHGEFRLCAADALRSEHRRRLRICRARPLGGARKRLHTTP